jgi:ribonuclease R
LSKRDRNATRRPRRKATARRANDASADLSPERVLATLRARGGRAATPTQLARALGVDARAVRGIRRVLRALEAQGAVERSEGRYRIRRDDGAVEARIATDARSGALVAVEESGTRWRLAEPGDAQAGDRVLVQPLGSGQAELLHRIETERSSWIGILHRRGGLSHATPFRDDGEWWLRVASTDAGDARDGDVVELVPTARRRRPHARADAVVWARVVRVLGRPGEADADTAAVIWWHNLPVEFPPAVLRELDGLAMPVPGDAGANDGRIDLRAVPFVTIDPEDARDFDDAISARVGPDGGLHLQVAVADVSHFVPHGSALDREAWRRGNSVYFPDRAIPMLPPLLSGDLCSLRPDEDRLALVAELDCDADANVRAARFHTAWIRSRARLTYAEAQASLDSGAGPHVELLARVAAWAEQRTRARAHRGGLDFELPGIDVDVAPDGTPREVRIAPRSTAHRLVEEAMLAANQSVAEWLAAAEDPGPYRNHEMPSHADTLLLAAHLEAFGVARDLPRDELPSLALTRALKRVPPEQAAVVHNLVLRHMRQARYGARSLGHYALALRHYLHFTSPIRRYADLVVHRAVKARLAGRASPAGTREVEGAAARASIRERIAQRAEREVVDLARCAFLRAHVGSEQEATVASIGRFGVFVTLARWPIDGLIPARRLPGSEPDALGHALFLRGGRRVRLGDAVRVRVAAVDVIRARIDLELLSLAEPEDQTRGPRGGARTKRPGGRSRSRAAATL